MQSKAPTVDAYVEEIPEERRSIFLAIRAIVQRAAPRCKEGMWYGIPSWDLDGHWVAFASQRAHVALFVSEPELVRELAAATGSRDFGMGCVRWTQVAKIRLEGVRLLIEAAAKRRMSPKPKPAPVPVAAKVDAKKPVAAKSAGTRGAVLNGATRNGAARNGAVKPAAARNGVARRGAVQNGQAKHGAVKVAAATSAGAKRTATKTATSRTKPAAGKKTPARTASKTRSAR